VYDYDDKTVLTPASIVVPPVNVLISFYGRLNYNFKQKYLLTATLRRDGSSRFGPDNRWGMFPSVALAWRINQESFLKDVNALSNLKLRLGYGITGQQDGIGNFDYLSYYNLSDQTARVQFGDQYYQMYRPAGYDPDRKWEQTATTNIGIDYGFLNNRIYGSVDYFYKKTTDLLNQTPIPMGSNFTNLIVKNVGDMNSKGVEGSINLVPVDNKDWHWELGYNITWNKRKITKLTVSNDPDYVGIQEGGISGGTSNTILVSQVGHTPRMFYVYKQLYDQDGKPIEGAYADLNGDGQINEKDKYVYKSSEPDLYMGFNTSLSWKKWTLATSLRASLGNYAYNNVASDIGVYAQVLNNNNFLMNTVKSLTAANFHTQQPLSDFYVQNASFLKMDYLQLSYNIGRLCKTLDLRLNATVQNVFTATKYDGVDPEIVNGIDNNFYPNSRTYSLGININF
jgi:iron complex outermembrane receptor protein